MEVAARTNRFLSSKLPNFTDLNRGLLEEPANRFIGDMTARAVTDPAIVKKPLLVVLMSRPLSICNFGTPTINEEESAEVFANTIRQDYVQLTIFRTRLLACLENYNERTHTEAVDALIL
jgi:hypothetical protein